MNSNGKLYWQGDPHWRERLVAASHHRARALLVETAAWTAFDPRLRPQHPLEWHLTLFAGLASAMPDLAEEALRHGANPTTALTRTWLGALHGKLAPTESTEAAYYWIHSYRWHLEDRVLVMTPLQAAVAGACPACIAQIVAAGANLDEVIHWLTPLRYDIPRIRAALTICEFIAEQKKRQEHKPIVVTWTKNMNRWLRSASKRAKHARTEKEPLAQVCRQLLRVGEAFGIEINLSSQTLAELL